jgi:hypothetical protein
LSDREQWLSLADQAFRQGGEFGAGISAPEHSPFRQHSDNRPVHGAAQGLDAVAGPEVCCLGKLIHYLGHGVVVEHASNAVGHRRHHLAPAGGGEFCKQRSDELSSYVREGVAVEEEEGGAAVAVPQEFYGLGKGDVLRLLFFPLTAARRLSLAIKAVLRASSCARSSVEADDKLPTPVFEKSGSGL